MGERDRDHEPQVQERAPALAPAPVAAPVVPEQIQALQGLGGGMAAALARSAVQGLTNSATGRVLARSNLSDEVSQIYTDEGQGAMFDRLRDLGVSDPDVETWIESALAGDERILARLIAKYGPETMWPEPREEYQAPFDVAPLSSAGERVLFNGNYVVIPEAVEHYHELVATATNGSFDTQGGPVTKTFRTGYEVNRIDTGNVSFFIPDQFEAGDTASVKIEIKARSTGRVLRTKTWNFTPRTQAPTELDQLEPGNEEKDIPGVFSYHAGPAIDGADPPYYEHHTVLEEFLSRTSNLDVDDMEQEWLTANGITDKRALDTKLFSGASNNGTFVLDDEDKMFDQHGGGQDMLDEAARHLKVPKEVHVDLPQTYTAGPGNVLGEFLVRRKLKIDGTYKVQKFKVGP